jgi:hypothetical protein
MQVITTTSDKICSGIWAQLTLWCEQILRQYPEHPAVGNMGWAKNSGLLWCIDNQSRWRQDQGEIAILLDDKELICGVSCVEHSVLANASIGGIRTWLNEQHRDKNAMSRYLLASNLTWSQTQHKQGMILSFNDYNKWIWIGVKRKSQGKAAGMGTLWSDWWNDCRIIDKQLRIRGVDQWCVVKPTGIGSTDIITDSLNAINDL